MERDRLFINEIEIDLAPGTVIALTLQINNIGEAKDRQANYSAQFKIPKSKRNRETLDDPDVIQTTTTNMYRWLPCRVVKEGISVIPKGISIIESADQFYNITVYSGNKDFFRTIEDLLLSDLDLSAYTHTFDFNTVVNTRANTYLDGYKYPIINYGKLQDTSIVDGFPTSIVWVNQLRPAVFVLALLDRLFTEAGYTVDYSDFVFEKLEKVMQAFQAPSSQVVNTLKDQYSFNAEVDAHSPDFSHFTIGSSSSNPNFLWASQVLPFEVPCDIEISDPGGNYDNILFRYVVPGTSTQTFNFTGSLRFHWEPPPGTVSFNSLFSTVRVTFYKNGSPIWNGDFIQQTNQLDNTFFFNVTVPPHPYVGGDIITCKASAASPGVNFIDAFNQPITSGISHSSYPNLFLYVDDAASISNTLITDVVYGEVVQLSACVGDMGQTAFLKSMLHLTCGMLQIDELQKKVYWKSFEDIKANIPFAKNWSKKLDPTREPITEYRLEGYGQTNYCNYLVDDNDAEVKTFASGLGNGSFDVDDETLERKVTVIEMPFAPTFMQKKLRNTAQPQGFDIPIIRKMEYSASSDDFTIDTAPRLLIDDTHDMPAAVASDPYYDSFFYVDSAAVISADVMTDIPFCYFILPNKTYNLGFNNNILELCYTAWIACLHRAKNRQEWLKLDAVDIMEMDHFIPVWIQEHGNYFYVNKVPGWVSSEKPLKVQLVRM